MRSACSRRRDRIYPSATSAAGAFRPDERNAFGLTADVRRLRDISGTAAARAVLGSHRPPQLLRSLSPIYAHRATKSVLLRNPNKIRPGCGDAASMLRPFGQRLFLGPIQAGIWRQGNSASGASLTDPPHKTRVDLRWLPPSPHFRFPELSQPI